MIEAAPSDDAELRAKYRDYKRHLPHEADDRVWGAVAEAFDLAGDGPRVLGALHRAIEINPEWGRHHLAAARAYLRAQQWRHALRALETCRDLDGSGLKRDLYSDNILYYLGYALFGAARYKEAAEAWRGADNDIQYWRNAEPLKDFHLHRGWAYHVERDLLDAIECYQRGLIAPGLGDCAMDDDMDPDLVEECQERLNPRIERYLRMAQRAEIPEPATLDAVPWGPVTTDDGTPR